MRRVMITGATGMLGAALVKECIKNKVETLAIVRKGSANLGRLAESAYVKVAKWDPEQPGELPIKGTYDVCYHFAWAHTEKEKRDNPVLQEQNIRYTLDAVRLAAGAGCQTFIGAGSQAEYGPKEGVIGPDTELSPQLAYGVAKYAAGMLSRKLCGMYGMTHIWGRICSVYGGNDNEGTMLSYAIRQFLKGEPARFSAATQMWDYLYEDDAARIFYLLGESVKEDKVYCIANGKSRPLKAFIMELAEAFGPQAQCEFAPDTEQPAPGLQADVNALFSDIAYEPVVPFQEGIKKMIAKKRKMLGGDRRYLTNTFLAAERKAA